jgi:hypothetical protein
MNFEATAKRLNGFVVFTRDFDSTCRHYLRTGGEKDIWTRELSEASILPHQEAFKLARIYRKSRIHVSVGQHGKVEQVMA